MELATLLSNALLTVSRWGSSTTSFDLIPNLLLLEPRTFPLLSRPEQ